ncbi:MAG TPA: formate dehydrogenase accessory sulfurtransferase FdhD [Pirellulales bacterium]|nr:formate dehydrogenase accessory sulfurtransferase FdhD [Pirellulales bacterium]
MALHHPGIKTVPIAAVTDATATADLDEVSVEEPLQISIRITGGDIVDRRSIAVTMRTPGADVELAAGFLFTEGIVRHKEDVLQLRQTSANEVLATLAFGTQVNLAQLERQSFISSSCGVCGKRSIAAVFAHRPAAATAGEPQVEPEVVHELAGTLRVSQHAFNRTGGLHASALFTCDGRLLSQYEDVGRHNALDKLIGSEFLAERIPLDDKLVLVSGRASFELVQKATMAGVRVLAAVGAPTSLAVSLASEARMTLLAFVRDGRFNVYSDAGRLSQTPAGLFSAPAISH